jgi:osmotically-inducible protein OsmY
MSKPLAVLALGFSLGLAGCTSLIATATGPEPIGTDQGKRTLSMRIEDSAIERTAAVNIYKADPAFRNANVNIVSFYGSVLIAGQVPTAELKAKAEKVVWEIAEVKRIHNELTVGEASYYQERMSDGLISTQVRTNLLTLEGFPSSRAKIFTVGGTVYLLGKLTQAEADTAVDIIKQVAGVKRIVKLVDTLPATARPAATEGAMAPAAGSAPAN